MKIAAVCLGSAERLAGKSYKTGIFKIPVGGAVPVDAAGLLGDAVCNRKHHGGPDQAVYVEGGETLKWWEIELGSKIESGTFGENLVIAGLDNRNVAAGDRFTIGDVVLEASGPRIPCATFAARMGDPQFARRYSASGRPGIYCRVIAGGLLSAGLAVELEAYAGLRASMPELMAACRKRPTAERLQALLQAPIGERLRRMLTPADS